MINTDNEVVIFLDNLRESGVTNMFGAVPYLVKEFGFDEELASAYLLEWMRNFGERHER